MPYSSEHKSQSRQRIIDSAIELFGRHGFTQVSIDQVMTLARLTRGAFYAHFESKEALYRVSFMQTLDRCHYQRLTKTPLSVNNLMQLVKNLLNLRTMAEQTTPSVENILFNEISSENPQIRELYEESYRNLIKLLEIRLTALSKLKRFAMDIDPAGIAEKSRTILATMVGAVAIARSIHNEAEIKKILIAAQNQILRSLGVAELVFDFAVLDSREMKKPD